MNTPEADDAFAILKDFLQGKNAPPDVMPLSILDGFLVAIAIAPEVVHPSEWLDVVWGDDPPVFEDNEQGSRILNALLRYYNETVGAFASDPPAFIPILVAAPDGGLDARDWCEGFMTGLGMRLEAWMPLIKSRKGGELLMPILAHCHDDAGEARIDMDEADRTFIVEHAQDLITGAVVLIDRFWKKKKKTGRRAPGTVSVSGIEMRVRVGRNDPCPCGSGQKYKKCCLPEAAGE